MEIGSSISFLDSTKDQFRRGLYLDKRPIVEWIIKVDWKRKSRKVEMVTEALRRKGSKRIKNKLLLRINKTKLLIKAIRNCL
jgi:hypothetical protein